MHLVQTDVLVIGGGASALLAALEARKEGCSVLLAAKGSPEESCTYYDGCDFRMQVDEASSDQLDAVQLLETGEGMCDPALTLRILREAPARVLELRDVYGLPMKTFRPLGQEVTGYLVDSLRITGLMHGAAMQSLLMAAVKKSGVRMAQGWFVYRLLKKNDRVIGALALDPEGEWQAISAKVTILASGNAGHIFARTYCPPGITGDGYALALRAGASLINMEFLRYFGVALTGSDFPYQRTSPPLLRLAGGRLINGAGEDLTQKWFGISLRAAFEVPTLKYEGLTKLVAVESQAGPVYLDFTGVRAADWERVLAAEPKSQEFLRRAPVDIRREPAPVAPLVYSNFGGVRINPETETGIPGLLATGRVAGGYMGAQATVPRFTFVVVSVVLGPASGRRAAVEASRIVQPDLDSELCQSELADAHRYRRGAGGSNRIGELFATQRRVMWQAAGPLRNEAGLRKGLAALATIREELERTSASTPQELRAALELDNALLAGNIILRAASLRKETRGIHLREDYPEKDADNWSRWITVRRKSGKLILGTEKVPC